MNAYIELGVFCGSILVYSIIFGIWFCVYEFLRKRRYKKFILPSIQSVQNEHSNSETYFENKNSENEKFETIFENEIGLNQENFERYYNCKQNI